MSHSAPRQDQGFEAMLNDLKESAARLLLSQARLCLPHYLPTGSMDLENAALYSMKIGQE